MGLSRKEEVIMLGPMLPGGDTEEEGDIMNSGILLGEEGVQTTHWASQPWVQC